MANFLPVVEQTTDQVERRADGAVNKSFMFRVSCFEFRVSDYALERLRLNGQILK